MGLTIAGICCALALAAAPAAAQIYDIPAGAGDAVADGACQLTEAVQAARTNAAVDGCAKGTGSDAILLAPGTHDVSTELMVGDPNDMSYATTLASAGPGGAAVFNTGSGHRVMTLVGGPAAGPVGVVGLTIRGGALTGTSTGGGVLVQDGANVTITDTTVTGNSVGGPLVVDLGSGGGIGATGVADPVATLTNVTISGNFATGDGGGLDTGAGLWTLNNVTIADNTANSDGLGAGAAGGIHKLGVGTLVLHNSIVAGNHDLGGTAPDCQGFGGGTLPTTTSNVFGDATGCNPTLGAGDVVGDPGLAPLISFDGLANSTHAIAGGLAVDRGTAPCPAADERGLARPQGAACDSGAFEFQPPAPPGGNKGPSVTPPAKCKKKKKKTKKRAALAKKHKKKSCKKRKHKKHH